MSRDINDLDHWSLFPADGCHDECPACVQDEAKEHRDSLQIEDWRDEVRHGDTKLGFEEWVEHNVESERDRILGDIAALHRLHAAAPALLAACQHLVSESDITPSQVLRECANIARAAIALTEPPKEPPKELLQS